MTPVAKTLYKRPKFRLGLTPTLDATAKGLQEASIVPRESYPRLFWRFLRFGLLAWGGPVAQIAMIRQELVEEEHWISRERFNRVLGVYQALPGPEAQELCVYFGMLSRGRWGAFLAGLGFMLPGFLLMFTLSWWYVTYGIASPIFAAIFFGFKPAVAALIVWAVYRIGKHAITNRWLLGITVAAGLVALIGGDALLLLVLAGLVYFLIRRRNFHLKHQGLAVVIATALFVLFGTLLVLEYLLLGGGSPSGPDVPGNPHPPLYTMFTSGFKAGMLTFGGAYTVIPFLQRDATGPGGWMTKAQFLDGLALGGILPAPLIIFSTFVGYLGGGPLGALLMTIGIFLPAFAFTIIGHGFFERVVESQVAQVILDGITAGVVGLIAAVEVVLSAAALTPSGTPQWFALVIFAVALALLLGWKSKLAVAAAVLAGGGLGLLALEYSLL